MPSVSVIIVSYRVMHYIEQCICSVLRSLPDAQIIVVDNRSDDGSVEFLRRRFPDVTVIANADNEGFGKANNRALEMAWGRYVLFLNPDTVVAERTLPGCIEYMDANPGTGAVGVRMQHGNGRFALESRRSIPTPWVSFCHMTGLGRLFPRTKLAKYHLTYYNQDEQCPIQVVSGAFMFVRKEALDRSGGFDESFFMYGEDIDLSYRLLEHGYENRYLPLPIVHYKGESTTKTSYSYAKVFYDAMLIFYHKHFAGYSILMSWLVKFIVGVKKLGTYVGQNLLAGKRALVEYKEGCIYVGRRETFGKASDLIGKSQVLENARFFEDIPFDLPNSGAVVFDIDAFSYNTVLDWFYSQYRAGKRFTMGLYSQSNGKLITEDEVLL